MHLTCERCETEFDTDREPVTAHQDTTRCPACGRSHDVESAAPMPAPADATLATDGGVMPIQFDGLDADQIDELHIHVHHE